MNSTSHEFKNCIVTGATSGIGKETAKALASKGYTILMVARNLEKAENVKEDIKSFTGNSNIFIFHADFNDLESVRTCAKFILEKFPVIDVLVNNAGLINQNYYQTTQGYEATFGINHLAPFLFTNILQEGIKRSEEGRIVNVASEAERMGKIDFENLNAENGYSPMRAYSQSKLANIIFTYELAERLKSDNVTVNCMHPGGVRTNFARNEKGFVQFIFKLFSPFLRTPEKGAETVIWLASDPSVKGITGKYFKDKKPIRSIAQSYDYAVRKKLWEVSEKMTNLS